MRERYHLWMATFWCWLHFKADIMVYRHLDKCDPRHAEDWEYGGGSTFKM
jgi:hypothetical protein